VKSDYKESGVIVGRILMSCYHGDNRHVDNPEVDSPRRATARESEKEVDRQASLAYVSSSCRA